MDDGSTDSTPRLLDAVQARDPRFRVLRHDKPAGVSNSLNELAAAADCEYLARMDADDVVLRTRWGLTERALRDADIAFTSVLFIDDRGKLHGTDQPGRFGAEAVPYHLTFGCCLVHPTVTMRRSAFDALGGYAQTRAEDYELWMRAAAGGYRMVRTATPGLLYRRHAGQVTVRQPWLAEDESSPLFTAYGSLLDTVLGDRPAGWKSVFASALGASEITPEVADDTAALHASVVEAAGRTLTRTDQAQVAWRARREKKRLKGRTRPETAA